MKRKALQIAVLIMLAFYTLAGTGVKLTVHYCQSQKQKHLLLFGIGSTCSDRTCCFVDGNNHPKQGILAGLINELHHSHSEDTCCFDKEHYLRLDVTSMLPKTSKQVAKAVDLPDFALPEALAFQHAKAWLPAPPVYTSPYYGKKPDIPVQLCTFLL